MESDTKKYCEECQAEIRAKREQAVNMIKDIGIMAINVGAYAVHKLPKGKVKNIAGEVQKVVAIAFKK